MFALPHSCSLIPFKWGLFELLSSSVIYSRWQHKPAEALTGRKNSTTAGDDLQQHLIVA